MNDRVIIPNLNGDALCAQVDPDAFFPDPGGSVRQAKRTCSRCDVRLQCLEWALATGERHGVWGGLTENERRKLRGGQAPINHGTEAGYGAHRRRGEQPCGACRAGLNLATRRRAARKRGAA